MLVPNYDLKTSLKNIARDRYDKNWNKYFLNIPGTKKETQKIF